MKVKEKKHLSYLSVFLNKYFEHQEAMLSLEAKYKIHLLFGLLSVCAEKVNLVRYKIKNWFNFFYYKTHLQRKY